MNAIKLIEEAASKLEEGMVELRAQAEKFYAANDYSHGNKCHDEGYKLENELDRLKIKVEYLKAAFAGVAVDEVITRPLCGNCGAATTLTGHTYCPACEEASKNFFEE